MMRSIFATRMEAGGGATRAILRRRVKMQALLSHVRKGSSNSQARSLRGNQCPPYRLGMLTPCANCKFNDVWRSSRIRDIAG